MVPFMMHKGQFRELNEMQIRTSNDRNGHDKYTSLEFKVGPHLGLETRFVDIWLDVRLINSLTGDLIEINDFEPRPQDTTPAKSSMEPGKASGGLQISPKSLTWALRRRSPRAHRLRQIRWLL